MIILLPVWYFGFLRLVQVRIFKSIEPPRTLITDRGLRLGIAELNRQILGDIDLQNLFKANPVLEKGVIKPEMVGSNGSVNRPARVDFEQVAHGQILHRYVKD